jgi:hypothetical protein
MKCRAALTINSKCRIADERMDMAAAMILHNGGQGIQVGVFGPMLAIPEALISCSQLVYYWK